MGSLQVIDQSPDRREMLLPIAGGAPAMDAVEQPKKPGVRKKAG